MSRAALSANRAGVTPCRRLPDTDRVSSILNESSGDIEGIS